MIRVRSGHLAHLGLRVNKELKARRVLQVSRGHRGQRGQREQREHVVLRARQVTWASRDRLGIRVRKVKLVPRESKAG